MKTPDPQLRQELLALAKKFEDAWNNNDATAVAALFTDDAVLIEDTGPVYGRQAIEKHYKDACRICISATITLCTTIRIRIPLTL